MLIGTYVHNLDVKGRLQVPAKLRNDLGETFIGTKGVGDCLFIFSLEQWNLLSNKLKDLPLSSQAAQGFLRMLFANAFECTPDKQGRILIPKALRDRIHLGTEAVVAGVMTRVEVWPKDAWEAYMDDTNADYGEILTQLESLGV